MTSLNLDAIEARANHAAQSRHRWASELGVNDPDVLTGLRQAKELAVDDVPALVAEVRRLRAELANHIPQTLTDEPGPDVTEVYDRDGHPWERTKVGLWCAFGATVGIPTSWGSLVSVWGPITTRASR